MAGPAPSASPQVRGATAATGLPLAPLVLAAAVPPLFLHATYQPTVSIPFGSADLDLTLADAAIAAVIVVAGLSWRREGAEPLRQARWLLILGMLFVALCALSLLTPLRLGEDYPLTERAVSVGKFAWYALLAPAVLLVVRAAADLVPLARAVVLWSGAATAWGLLQFAGVVAEFEGKRPGQREPSFVGIHDFAALSAAALVVGLVGLVYADGRPAGRSWTWPALVVGGLGIVLSGAMTAVAGLWLAAAVLLLLARRAGALRRRAVAVTVAAALAVAVGTSLMRAETLTRFAEFLGLRDRTEETGVESYAQRTLLAYLGIRIFLDHPLAGVGWLASSEEWAYGPFLDDARERFPDEPEEAFPSPERPWGVQNLTIQVAADLGLVGLAALVALAIAAIRSGVRGASRARAPALGLAWLLVAAGVWGGIGLVAGIPVLALTWIAIGLTGVREDVRRAA